MKDQSVFKFGNSELSKDIMISSMGNSEHCPSRKLGLCKIVNAGISCYARKPEQQYIHTRKARKRWIKYWTKSPIEQIIGDASEKLYRKRKKPKFFRFNEAGDFWDQDCIDKIVELSKHLYANFGIITYGYTARRDLSYPKHQKWLVIRGSGWKGPSGQTEVIEKHMETPRGFVLCPKTTENALCGEDCDMCPMTKKNIAFWRH